MRSRRIVNGFIALFIAAVTASFVSDLVSRSGWARIYAGIGVASSLEILIVWMRFFVLRAEPLSLLTFARNFFSLGITRETAVAAKELTPFLDDDEWITVVTWACARRWPLPNSRWVSVTNRRLLVAKCLLLGGQIIEMELATPRESVRVLQTQTTRLRNWRILTVELPSGVQKRLFFSRFRRNQLEQVIAALSA